MTTIAPQMRWISGHWSVFANLRVRPPSIWGLGQNGWVSSTPRPEPARRSYQRSATGLIGAILACLGLILVVFLLTLFQPRHTSDPAGAIDYTRQLEQARKDSAFHVVAPATPPKGMRPTSVDWQPVDRVDRYAHWHLGFVTKSGEYIGLEQGDAPVRTFVAAHTVASVRGASVTIARQRWQTLSSSHEVEHAYFRTVRGVTTLVTGTATPAELMRFIRALR
jgi:hypothetical protein